MKSTSVKIQSFPNRRCRLPTSSIRSGSECPAAAFVDNLSNERQAGKERRILGVDRLTVMQ